MLGLQATTLRRVEEWLAASALRGRRRLPEGARSLAIEAVLETTEPGPFAPVVAKRGFARAVERFVEEVAAGGARFEESCATRRGGCPVRSVRACRRSRESASKTCSS